MAYRIVDNSFLRVYLMEEARWTTNDNIAGGQPVPNKPYLKLTTRVNLVAENGWIVLNKGVVPIGSSVTIRAKVRPHTSSFPVP